MLSKNVFILFIIQHLYIREIIFIISLIYLLTFLFIYKMPNMTQAPGQSCEDTKVSKNQYDTWLHKTNI